MIVQIISTMPDRPVEYSKDAAILQASAAALPASPFGSALQFFLEIELQAYNNSTYERVGSQSLYASASPKIAEHIDIVPPI